MKQPGGDRQGRPGGRPKRIAVALVGAAVFAIATSWARPSGAAIGQPLQVQPSSGPPGTPVTVSGTACTGFGSSSVSVSSTSLPLNQQVSVAGNGSWSTTFTIPSGTLPLPALIAAVCSNNGLPSLLTSYLPATFVVTGALPPTTPPPPTILPSGPTTPTTNATSPTNKKPGRASPDTGGGSSAAGSGSSRSGTRRGGADGLVGTSAMPASAAEDSGRVAGLRSPDLASDATDAPGGVSWWWWVVLALLVGGAVAAWAWLRRHPAVPPTEPTVEAPAAPAGDAAVDPVIDDELPTVVDELPVSSR
jgi:hypothetical protein